ncbi:MAG: acetylxylan esterase [Phycisphaerales bacterium]|nr:acetylxylan esterase [Phycisphaerales bacterium]
MPLFDLPLEKLREYQPVSSEPADFDAFWSATCTEAADYPLRWDCRPVEHPLYRHVQVEDVTFAGYAGQPIRGWLLTPTTANGRLPGLVSFVGYGGGRGLPIDHVAPVMAGFAHFVMDTRGQGSGWAPGDTPDEAGAGPQHPGFLTRGIESPATYYYRRVIVDGLRAVVALRTHTRIDPARLALTGGSQGGGIALAVAGLLGDGHATTLLPAALRTANDAPGGVRALACDVPFLCHFRRAVELTDQLPYAEITRYLKCHRDRVATVFNTLAYFDGVHFAARVRVPTLFSVGLMDTVCPPSTIFAAYNQIPSTKDIRIYTFNEHEGGGSFQLLERLEFLQRMLGD